MQNQSPPSTDTPLRLFSAGAPSSRRPFLTHRRWHALFYIFSVLPLLGSDWPQWLGPERNGVSPEKGLLDRFPLGGPEELWRQPIGEGFSGLAVVGENVFTLFSDGSDEYAASFDARTGSERWRTRIGHAFYDKQGGDGPRATPAVVDNAVYVLGAHGDLLRLKVDSGKVVWRRSLTKDFDGELPNWGFTASPLVVDEHVYVSANSPGEGSLIALTANRGRVVWRTRPGKSGYASPRLMAHGSSRNVVFFTGTELTSVDAKTGDVRWYFPWKTAWQANAATPTVLDKNRIFITSSYGRGGALLQIRDQSEEPGLDVLWRSRFGSQFGTPVSDGEVLFGFDGSRLAAMRLEDGSNLWSHRGFGKGTLILADGKLIILTERGRLVLAHAKHDSFLSLGEVKVLQGRCWTAPSLANGKLYLRGPKEMVCLRLSP